MTLTSPFAFFLSPSIIGISPNISYIHIPILLRKKGTPKKISQEKET